jgi:hypothetical protein
MEGQPRRWFSQDLEIGPQPPDRGDRAPRGRASPASASRARECLSRVCRLSTTGTEYPDARFPHSLKLVCVVDAAETNPLKEFDWVEVKRVKRRARFPGESDALLIYLQGKKTQLRKIVVVPSNLSADGETKAILDRIANNAFLREW